ncbi:MAG TPA: hypothetical protein VFA50_21170 [Stellaceae bacterium]|nr:hypothetical protein [Stellaceae bacterium]
MMMMRVPLLAVILALSACSALLPAKEDQKQLSLACEVARCECRAARSGFAFTAAPAPAPIEWRTDGSASCPAGYQLSRVE